MASELKCNVINCSFCKFLNPQTLESLHPKLWLLTCCDRLIDRACTNLCHAEADNQCEEASDEPAPSHGDNSTIRQARVERRCDASHHGENRERDCEVRKQSAQHDHAHVFDNLSYRRILSKLHHYGREAVGRYKLIQEELCMER